MQLLKAAYKNLWKPTKIFEAIVGSVIFVASRLRGFKALFQEVFGDIS